MIFRTMSTQQVLTLIKLFQLGAGVKRSGQSGWAIWQQICERRASLDCPHHLEVDNWDHQGVT